MFDQKSWNNRLPLHERMALFVTERPAPSHPAGDAEKKDSDTTKQNEGLPKDICSKEQDLDTTENSK